VLYSEFPVASVILRPHKANFILIRMRKIRTVSIVPIGAACLARLLADSKVNKPSKCALPSCLCIAALALPARGWAARWAAVGGHSLPAVEAYKLDNF